MCLGRIPVVLRWRLLHAADGLLVGSNPTWGGSKGGESEDHKTGLGCDNSGFSMGNCTDNLGEMK